MIVKFYLKSLKKSSSGQSLTDAKRNEIELYNKSLSNTETFIELRARYDGQLLIYNTGIKVLPKIWDGKKQRIKPQASRHVDNTFLQHIESLSQELYTKSRLSGSFLSPQEFRVLLDEQTRKKPSTEKSVLEYFAMDFVAA